jgi:lipid II:glycine glycyltransferase (peptidoglycan interpeptide bridge formation enzyme)
MNATTMISLAPAQDRLLARMRASTRYNIRLALRRGVQVREGTRQDIDRFYDLLRATCERRGERPMPSDKAVFHGLWREFGPLGWVRLAMAEYRGEPVCGEFGFAFSDVYRTWKFGWSGQHAAIKACDAVTWNSICHAKQHGFAEVDLVQVDLDVARAVSSGKPVPPDLQERRMFGPTFHKMGFGGRIVPLPHDYVCFPDPVLRLMYKTFGRHVLQRDLFVGLVDRVGGIACRRSHHPNRGRAVSDRA